MERIPIDRPIFVLGLQGGGTTLVTRCLLRHPSVVSMSGNSSYWVATDELGFVRNRMAALPPSLWSSSHRHDLAHPIFGTDHRSVWACDELLPAYRRTANDAPEADAALFKRVLREHIAVYARDRGNARFVDKTHANAVRIPYIDALLDGCEPFFVLVLRNPYAICPRTLRRKPPSWSAPPPYGTQLALAAQHWENIARLALEDGRRTGRFGAIRFEDFLRNPEAVVRAICELVGLSYTPELVPRPGDACRSRRFRWTRSGIRCERIRGRPPRRRSPSSPHAAESSRRGSATSPPPNSLGPSPASCYAPDDRCA